MLKMIFSDFDNTMLNYYSNKNYFDNYQIEVLRKIQDKGIKFCVVTGRSVSFFYQFFNLLEVIDYIIGSNGACIFDVKNKKFIYQELIDYQVLNGLINYAIKNHHSFLLNCLDKRYQYGEWKRVKGEKYIKNKEYDCEQMVLSFDKMYKDDIANFTEDLKKIVVNNSTDRVEEISIDINNKNVSKGKSIEWLCNKLSINVDDTIGFGDGENDVSMFKVVGKSISVENASNNVKSLSNDITLSCEEYGIYKYIENNVLK